MWVEHPRHTRFACPECEREPPVYDHAEEREWRHLDSCRVARLKNPSNTMCAVQSRMARAEKKYLRIIHTALYAGLPVFTASMRAAQEVLDAIN